LCELSVAKTVVNAGQMAIMLAGLSLATTSTRIKLEKD